MQPDIWKHRLQMSVLALLVLLVLLLAMRSLLTVPPQASGSVHPNGSVPAAASQSADGQAPGAGRLEQPITTSADEPDSFVSAFPGG